MGLRLGFAVAAHLETEILLVDEVLAVGDTNFQKRCLGKMQDVTNQGRTVLFVSHSMPAIRNLCQQAVVLAHGREIFDGEVNEAITFYMQRMDNTASGVVDLKDASRLGTGEMRLLRFWVEDETHQIVSSVPSGKRCFLAVEYVSADGASRRDVSMSIVINTVMGSPVTLVNTNMLNQNFEVAPPQGIIRLELPRLPLTAGRYLVDLNLATHGGLSYADFLKAAAAFIVEDGDYYGTGRPGNPGAPVIFDGRWYIGEEHTYSW
jgi:lipopolysaccharide transport system ATP-binding protein